MSTRYLVTMRYLLVAAICSLVFLPMGIAPLPPTANSSPQEETPLERAHREHCHLFGECSSVLLIDPDPYLLASGFDSKAAERDIRARLNTLRAVDWGDNPEALEKAVDLVKATTGFLGPATIRVESITALGCKPIVLVVSHDSARPYQIALHSLAGLDDPTVNLMPEMSFEELQSFTRFHESAHAFQHWNELHEDKASEIPYLHAHEEAEADAFAVLAWFKLREAHDRVPKIWFALRLCRYVEMLRDRKFDQAIEYYTYSSVRAALCEAQVLHKSGTLSRMDGNALYFAARRIVRSTIPSEPKLRAEARQLAAALEKVNAYPLRKRLASIEAHAGEFDATTSVALNEYACAMRELLKQSDSREPNLCEQECALRCWRAQLDRDLIRTKHRALVLERLQVQLAGETLNLAFSTASGDEKRMIKTDGHRDLSFVPIDTKYSVLEELRRAP